MRATRCSLAFAFAAILTAVSAFAQTTYTWTGQAGDGLFNTPGNWQGGLVPTGASTDNIVFGVYPLQHLKVTTSLNVGDITFNGIQDGFYLEYQFPDAPVITLNGNVTTTSGSKYWGLFDVPVVLSAGNHIYTPGGNADLYHFSNISGAGGITLNGPNNLILSKNNSYSGGTTINAGTLYVGSNGGLGTGTVTMNGGTLATSYTNPYDSSVPLNNNFVLGPLVTFGSYASNSLPMVLGSNLSGTTVAPAGANTNVVLQLVGKDTLSIDGQMINGTGPTSYSFEGNGSPGFVLSGSNSYTGGTVIGTGTNLRFELAAALPTTGLVKINAQGYAGLGDNSLDAPTFLSRIDHTNSAGIIGFDNAKTYTGAVDLSGFTNPNLAVGTLTVATLTGPITPVVGSGVYNFAGSGILSLKDAATPNPFTGSNGLVVRTAPTRSPFMLHLRPTGTNNYSGSTLADGAGIVFDSSGSLSAASTINLANGGYVSVTDTSGLTLGNIISKLGTVTNGGVLGLDASSFVNNTGNTGLTDSNPIDLRSLTQNVYLGTATINPVTLNGTIQTINNDTGDYYLTGYNGGFLIITSQLTGNRALHVGIAQDLNSYSGVQLTNATNNFTGGVILNANNLFAQNPLSLGTGTITVDAATNGYAALSTNGTVANNLNLLSGNLEITEDITPIVLNGFISGTGGITSLARDGNELTFVQNNSYTGGNTFGSLARIIAANNIALGSGDLTLLDGARVMFTSAAPGIGSLLEGTTYDDGDGTVISSSLVLTDVNPATLTINQTQDAFFEGAIVQGTGVGSLVKNGSGSLTIGGTIAEDNIFITPYAGGTTINQGKLIAGSNTALGTGTITLNGGFLDTLNGVTLANAIAFGVNGGTLGGKGSIGAHITAGTNVVLAPGASPGTLTFTSGLTLAPGGQLNFEVQAATGAPGTGYDLVNVSGGLLDITATPGSPFTLKLISLNLAGTAGNVSDFNPSIGYTWMLFQGNPAAGITGYSASNFTLDTSSFTNSLNGGVFYLTQGGNGPNPAFYLNFAPVPEPTSYALLAVGLASLTFVWRRQRC